MLFHLITPSLCLLPVALNVFVLIGTVQTVSTAQLNLCQRVVNRHTIIDSHCASSSSEIHEVLKFWSTLTKLSPSIRCDVPSGGCCMFIAGLQVDRLKQALGSISGTPVKLYFNWLFFCTSITRDTFFAGISRIFLSGTLESGHHVMGELFSARVIDCFIGCSHPGTWRIPIGNQSYCCFYQPSHHLLHDWVT